MWKKGKVVKGIIVTASVMIIIVIALVGYYKLCMDPYRGTIRSQVCSLPLDEKLTKEEAKEDLQYLFKTMQSRHPMWLEKNKEKTVAVKQQYQEELDAISGDITVLELYQASARIIAKLKDGHSRAYWNGENERYIDDFTQLRELGKPISINGISCEKLLEVYKKQCSYEFDFYAEELFYNNVIICESGLRACGVDIDNGVTMTFLQGSEEKEYTYTLVLANQINGMESPGWEEDWVSYQIDEDKNVGVFKLLECTCNGEYLETLDAFFQEVFSKNITNIVVDLRDNGGGDSWVANEFIKYLDVDEYNGWDCGIRFGWYLKEYKNILHRNIKKEQTYSQNVYVLTNTNTYSSAMDFAMLIEDNHLGKIVGEPSGNMPDSYGDILSFQLPNSKLMMTVSHKRWHRIDRTKEGQPLMPDYEVESDKALLKVFDLIQE